MAGHYSRRPLNNNERTFAMEEHNYCVYKHTSPSGKVYIGITKQNPQRRWQGGIGYKQHPHFARAIEKYGWDNFSHEIVAVGLTEEEAKNKERELIRELNATDRDYGYNMTFGGEVGSKFTDEVKEKISKSLTEYFKDENARKANAERATGRKHSEETKRKMSETHKRIVTDEFRNAARQRRLGKKFPNAKGHPQTEETKRKISESKRGKHYGGKGSKARAVICLETGVVYESAARAHDATGCGCSNIYRCCNASKGTANGLSWRYANEYNGGREIAL